VIGMIVSRVNRQVIRRRVARDRLAAFLDHRVLNPLLEALRRGRGDVREVVRAHVVRRHFDRLRRPRWRDLVEVFLRPAVPGRVAPPPQAAKRRVDELPARERRRLAGGAPPKPRTARRRRAKRA
jgi:hypothetical protein